MNTKEPSQEQQNETGCNDTDSLELYVEAWRELRSNSTQIATSILEGVIKRTNNHLHDDTVQYKQNDGDVGGIDKNLEVKKRQKATEANKMIDDLLSKAKELEASSSSTIERDASTISETEYNKLLSSLSLSSCSSSYISDSLICGDNNENNDNNNDDSSTVGGSERINRLIKTLMVIQETQLAFEAEMMADSKMSHTDVVDSNIQDKQEEK